MAFPRRRQPSPGSPRIVQRVVWVLAALILLVAPALDLAWNEPALDGTQGAPCQLHANPGVALEAPSLAIALSAGLVSVSYPPARLSPQDCSIFVPPRA